MLDFLSPGRQPGLYQLIEHQFSLRQLGFPPRDVVLPKVSSSLRIFREFFLAPVLRGDPELCSWNPLFPFSMHYVSYSMFVMHHMFLEVHCLPFDHHQWVLVLLSGGITIMPCHYYYSQHLFSFHVLLIRTKDRTYAKVCCAISLHQIINQNFKSNKLLLCYHILKVFLV